MNRIQLKLISQFHAATAKEQLIQCLVCAALRLESDWAICQRPDVICKTALAAVETEMS